MRILILTQWFDPEPTPKGLRFACALRDLGHEVEVLTGFPNYPGGKFYDGYNVRLLQREKIDGISVLRVPLYPSHDLSAAKRIAYYASFAISAAILGAVLVKRADVIYAYQPVSAGLAAAFIGFARRIPFIYDIQDLWPDTLFATGMLNNRKALKIVGACCNFVYRKAGKIVVLSPGFKEELTARGVPENKIEVIYNWCDEVQVTTGYDEVLKKEIGFADRFNVVYAGGIGKAQALDTVLDAAKIVCKLQPSVQFVFIGDGVEAARLRARIANEEITNCLYLTRRPVSEIGPLLQLADVLLVHLRNDPLFSITIPSKTQAYMAAGRPILMAVRGNAAELVEQAGAGIICSPENPEELARTVLALQALPKAELDKLGENGKKSYEKNFSFKVGVARIGTLLEQFQNKYYQQSA